MSELADFLIRKIEEADSLPAVNAIARSWAPTFARLSGEEQRLVKAAAERRRGFLAQHPGEK